VSQEGESGHPAGANIKKICIAGIASKTSVCEKPSPLRADRSLNRPMMKRVEDREGSAVVCCAPHRQFRSAPGARRRL
jgi:hypothetical protein